MPSLWFCVPAHGRVDLAAICLRQLRRTCDALAEHGIDASAVVVADDGNLDTARDLGFATVRRDNLALGRKFNDGIQLACDYDFNPRPVDYVVPCGSDDWVDHRLFLDLPPADTILCFRRAAFVNEDASAITSLTLDYPGGVGVRVYPRAVVAPGGTKWVSFRPADEPRPRACDTSMLINVGETVTPKIRYDDLHAYQIVDWKTSGEQLNSYREIMVRHRRGGQPADPFETLVDVYPAVALEEMRTHYEQTRALVAA